MVFICISLKAREPEGLFSVPFFEGYLAIYMWYDRFEDNPTMLV